MQPCHVLLVGFLIFFLDDLLRCIQKRNICTRGFYMDSPLLTMKGWGNKVRNGSLICVNIIWNTSAACILLPLLIFHARRSIALTPYGWGNHPATTREHHYIWAKGSRISLLSLLGVPVSSQCIDGGRMDEWEKITSERAAIQLT